MQTDPTNNLPTVSSRYQLKKKLGAGGMGVVYEAYDNVLTKVIAIKILQGGFVQGAALRFQVEAKATAKLDHPNIVRVLDVGESDRGDLYLIMEYIEGQTLSDLIKGSGPLSVEQALPIFEQICCGLEHAHANKVLHRDVKPSNIMLLGDADDCTIKIVDFGLAKLGSQDQRLTATGEPIGSPFYMSPEQARGEHVDERSDIYSLGALMFMVLKGEPPLQGESHLETIKKHANESAPRLNDGLKSPIFPRNLEEVVDFALKRDPAQRCQTVSELRQLLSAVQESVTISSVTTDEEITRSHPSGRRLKSSLILLALVLALATYLMVVGVALIDQDKPKEKSKEIPQDSQIFTKQMACFDWLIANQNIHDDKIKKLAGYNNIKLLKIIDPKLADSDLNYLVDLPIEVLDLSGTNISDNGLKTLAKMPALKVLILNDNPGITNSGAETISTMRHLDYVTLRGTNVDDEGVAKLSESMLKGIDISGLKQITSKSLNHLADARALTVLRIGSTSIRGTDLKQLASYKNLRHLSVSGLGLADSDLDSIAPLKLFNLDISNNDISDQGLEKVHPFLFGILDIRGCPKISKQEIESIYERRKLKYDFASDWPYIVCDNSAKDISWSQPIKVGAGVFDPEMFWGRVPLDWLDLRSESVLHYLGGRNEVARNNKIPGMIVDVH